MHHSRRKNGSKKVPNVKLRPAGRAAPEAKERHEGAEENTDFDPGQ